MNVDSGLYNELNGGQIRDANELLDRIKEDGVKRAELILDVGCGSGNVTAMLSSSIPHSKIIALDVDSDMIKFSKLHISDPTIEFHLQDISQPWSKLDPKIRDLEGLIDLVWSNRVLHWVDEIGEATRNILRLLRPGGRLYANVTLQINFNETLPEEERVENEKFIKIPSREEQAEDYKNWFIEAGLSSISTESYAKFWAFDKEEHLNVNVNGIHILKRFLNPSIPKEEQDKVLDEKFKDLFIRGYSTPVGETLLDKPDGSITDHYAQLRLTGIKK